MCGISGIWNSYHDHNICHNIELMNNTLFHRGPDVGDTWVEQNDGIAFGHRRLSIVDLSHYGDQPMRSLCGRYIIVFNGDIYNYKQLMNDLIASSDGIKLNGHSDTEILLNYISVYGLSKALKKLLECSHLLYGIMLKKH